MPLWDKGDKCQMATKKSTTTSKKPAAAAVSEGSAPEADPAAPTKAAKAPSLKLKVLLDRVAEATGGKKKGLREIVEATLTAVGEALSRGEDLNLPGLGRTRVARSAEKDGASPMTLKVRRGAHKKKEAKEPLADEGDDG